MQPLKEEELWAEVVSRADLGTDVLYLGHAKYEFKRSTLFLRTNGVPIPEPLTEKLRVAAASLDYTFRITAKWATMADLELAVGEVSWLWKDWLPKEMITILAGEPGTGKSRLALWFCKIVAQGLQWPDGLVQEPGKVLFIDAEAAQVITKERCHEMAIPLDRVYVPNLGNDMLAQPDLNDESHKEQVWNMVEDIQPKLIVVDSLGGVKSGRENNKEDMQPTMLYLTQLVRNRGCGMLVLHHLNKQRREEGEEIALNHLRGSVTIAQFARSVLFMAVKPQGVRLWVGKSNIAKLAPPLLVSFVTTPDENGDSVVRGFDFREWEDETKTTKLQECEQWIVNTLLYNHGEMGAREVFEASKTEPFTLGMVKAAGKELEVKGLIRRSGGKYSVWTLAQLGMPLPMEEL